jgi:hypothetical protein
MEKLMNSVRPLGVVPVALGAILLIAGPAQAATVVASRGPSATKFPIGTKLAAGARLVLVQGDMVTLLDEKGTRVLNGPGNFNLSQSNSDSRQSVFAALVQDRTSVRVRTGSVRAGPNGEPPRAPNLWYVDVTRPGTYCVTALENVRLWRPAMGTASTITVKHDAASNTITFGKDDMVAPWDNASFPVKTGASYELVGTDGRSMGNFDFKLVQTAPEVMEDLAGLLIGAGCTRQLDLLSSSVMLPEG